jgi:multidrug resistance efflux pump
MRKFDIIGLISVLSLICVGIVNYTKSGYRSNNSIILARNMTLTSTIDGQVNNKLPKVGDVVTKDDLLVNLLNGRIDKSRLVDYKSQIVYLESEINSTKILQLELNKLYNHYAKKAEDYAMWLVKDTQLRNIENQKQLIEAQKIGEVKSTIAKRINKLYKNKHSSSADQQLASAEAHIAKTNVEINLTQIERRQLFLTSVENNGVFFDGGETSYWQKMVDSILIKKIDAGSRLSSLQAELRKLNVQVMAEQQRIDSSLNEKITAPFNGIISSIYVNQNTNVSSGTSLLQILDCSNPVVIIPIPDHKLGEFVVGMKVSVSPVDSDSVLHGKIDYISSGPMIASDKTMILQEDMTINGNKAIVSLENKENLQNSVQKCDISRKAIVVIHT